MSTHRGIYISASSGGEYELLGPSTDAGTLRGSPEELVYRDTSSGRIFRRQSPPRLER